MPAAERRTWSCPCQGHWARNTTLTSVPMPMASDDVVRYRELEVFCPFSKVNAVAVDARGRVVTSMLSPLSWNKFGVRVGVVLAIVVPPAARYPRTWTRVDANSAPAPSSALFRGSSAPCTGAGGSRIPGILGNRLLSSGSTCAGRRIALRFAAAVLGHLRVRRVDSVSKQHRSFLLASLLPAFLLVSVFAVVQAQNAGSPAAKPTRWSDPATWPDRQGARRRRQGHHCEGQGCASSTSVRRRWAV